MIIEELEELQGLKALKNIIIEQFRGGKGKGNSLSRRKKDQPPNFFIFIFFVLLYSITFLHFSNVKLLLNRK
jgi:hypothetical protein